MESIFTRRTAKNYKFDTTHVSCECIKRIKRCRACPFKKSILLLPAHQGKIFVAVPVTTAVKSKMYASISIKMNLECVTEN